MRSSQATECGMYAGTTASSVDAQGPSSNRMRMGARKAT